MSRCNHVEFSKCLRDVPSTFRALRNEERIAHGEGLRLPFRIRNGHRSREDRHHFMDRVALKRLLAGRVLPNPTENGLVVRREEKMVHFPAVVAGKGLGRSEIGRLHPRFRVAIGTRIGLEPSGAVSLECTGKVVIVVLLFAVRG